ncbi:MAG: SPFH domain-containing protein [Candidatus Diapherotrites archaeon]|nr:SPFH domain-containing protein [Candidatus Diapherotrites archaeon]
MQPEVFKVIFEIIFLGFFGIIFVSAFVKVVMQYQRGVLFTLGKFSRIMEPGVNVIVPVIQSWRRLDTRIRTLDIPAQEVMTKDNVPVKINAVIYYRVIDPEKAVLNIEDYHYAVSRYGQTSLRDVAGEVELDDLLSKRDSIANKLRDIVDKGTDPWGIDVTEIKLQDIEIAQELKRTIMKQAETEREKRSLIIKAEGEVIASDNMAKAAEKLASSPGGLHLRTLQTLNDLSSDQSNTVVFVTPIELLDAISGFTKKKTKM